jgi:hypothetical protein
MKTTCNLYTTITPVVISAFLYATSPSYCHGNNPPSPTPKVYVAYTNGLNKPWTDLPQVDLSAAKYNPSTGLKEITVVVDLPYNPMMKSQLFFKSSSTNLTIQYIHSTLTNNTNSSHNSSPTVIIGCVGIVLAILVIVIAGVVIYYLIQTCEELLGD